MSHPDHQSKKANETAARLRADARRRLRRWINELPPGYESPVSKTIAHLIQTHRYCSECLFLAQDLQRMFYQ